MTPSTEISISWICGSESRGPIRRRAATLKPRCETAGSRKSAIAISPRRPDARPSRPPTGEMPLVESVAIAWQTATNGRVAGEDQRPAPGRAVRPA